MLALLEHLQEDPTRQRLHKSQWGCVDLWELLIQMEKLRPGVG